MQSQIKNLMDLLDCTEDEAKDILIQDKIIDKGGKTSFDLDKETEKVAAKFAHAGTRKKTVYKWDTRKRKENPIKRQIIAEIFDFFNKNPYENVKISNIERQIAFSIGENSFELTLVQKRKPKTD
jgi:hypothetical protein